MFVNRPELRLGLLILPKSADLKIIKTIAVLEATSSLPNTNAHTQISQGFWHAFCRFAVQDLVGLRCSLTWHCILRGDVYFFKKVCTLSPALDQAVSAGISTRMKYICFKPLSSYSISAYMSDYRSIRGLPHDATQVVLSLMRCCIRFAENKHTIMDRR